MQIRFTFDTRFGPFSDALYLDEGHTLTDAQIEAMKQERLANWLAVVDPVVDPNAVDAPPAEGV
jgi:hypothetical protein